MQQSQKQQGDSSFSLVQMEGFFFALAHIFSFVPTLMLRQSGLLGKRYATGIRCLGTFAPCVIMAYQNDPLTPIGLYGPFFLLVWHRLAGVVRWKTVREYHSQYDGKPLRIFLWLFRQNELLYKRVEPLIVVGLGLLMMNISVGFGTCMILGGVGMSATFAQCHRKFEAQARAMQDARIEQGMVFQTYQELERRQ